MNAYELAVVGIRERGILFSAPMVQAILAGRKTKTRRLVRMRPLWSAANSVPVTACPYGRKGDILWVRETWGLYDTDPKDGPAKAKVFYRATDGARHDLRHQLWRPSIFLPRWASRIDLQITNVRAERLQMITEEDAKAEGATWTDYGRHCFHQWPGPGKCPAPDEHHPENPGWSLVPTTHHDQCLSTARNAFGSLWNEINGKKADWNSNPLVWVVEFARLK